MCKLQEGKLGGMHAPTSYNGERRGPGRAGQWEHDKVAHWRDLLDPVLARVRHIRAAAVAVEQHV